MTSEAGATAPSADLDSAAAWRRLVASTVLCTIGGVGMWSFVVVLPTVQAEFGVARAGASLPFTLTMIGFAFGSVLMGQLLDRFGGRITVLAGTALLAGGFAASTLATGIGAFALCQGVIGIGSAAMLGPLLADISQWFTRRRGIAVAICSAGNMLAGALWPPLVQQFTAASGWRTAHLAIAGFCLLTMIPIALIALRRTAPKHAFTAAGAALARDSLGVSPRALMILLLVAGVACCTAMAMPQVHLVAYCGDLGFGPARGAQMLSLMMTMGIVSRLASGFIADRLGGLATLLLGTAAQGCALVLYLSFDGMTSLYVISALFGLFQGGIVPSYAIIIREYFPPREAGTRVGLVLMATLFGMAFGGWISGLIFDLTGSYQVAFLHGLLWNLLNVGIILWLVARPRPRLATA